MDQPEGAIDVLGAFIFFEPAVESYADRGWVVDQ